jgi:cell wall-associated NlpC family hydrolase
MTRSRTTGRHRAAAARTGALKDLAKTLTEGTAVLNRQAAVVAAASGLVLAGGAAAQAAEPPTLREASAAVDLGVEEVLQPPLTADSAAPLAFERPVVSSSPAPAPRLAAAPPVARPEPAPARAAAVPASPAKAAVSAPAPVQAAPAVAPAGGVNAVMVSAAYAQLGLIQDCTALVEKALGAAGIPVGDLAPMQFMNYGRVVSQPEPGDMVVQPGHVGIYVGNGQVLSSGMNGKNETVVHPLSWLTATGPVTFVRAGA